MTILLILTFAALFEMVLLHFLLSWKLIPREPEIDNQPSFRRRKK